MRVSTSLFLLSTAEDPSAFKTIVAFEDPRDRFGINFVLFGEDAGRERFERVPVEDRDGGLQKDRAAVEVFVNEMHCTSGHLDAMNKRLVLRVETGECGKQGGMDVQNATRKLPNEMAAQQTHVTGQTDEVAAVLPKQISDLRVESGAILAGGFDRAAGEGKLAGERQALRLRFI